MTKIQLDFNDGKYTEHIRKDNISLHTITFERYIFHEQANYNNAYVSSISNIFTLSSASLS